MERRWSPVNLVILTLTLVYGGWVGLSNARLKWASSNWMSVPGQIESSEVASRRHNTRYAQVEYTYSVGGSAYRNDRLSLGDGVPSGFADADDFVQRHPPGTPVVVYYDPRDPSKSSISTAGSPGAYLFLTLLCWGFAGVSLRSALRSRHEP